MRSFSKRLTRRIVIALMLTLALVTAGIFYQAFRIMGLMTSAYYGPLNFTLSPDDLFELRV